MFGASPADQRLYQLAAQGLLGGQNPTQIGNVYNTSTGQVMRGGSWVDPASLSAGSPLASATSGAGAGSQAEDLARLEQQRQAAERLLQQWRDFYPNSPEASQLQGQIQARASGQEAPLTDQAVAQIVANQASGAEAQLQDEQELIRRRFANSGIGGGGGQLQSELDARRGYNAQVADARNQTEIQQQLQNFTAQANAQAQLQQLLAEQAQNLGSGTAATANFMGGYGVSGGGAETNNLLAGMAGGGGSYRALGQPNQGQPQQNSQFQAAIQAMLGGLGGGQQVTLSGLGVPTNSLGQSQTTKGGVNPLSLSSSSLTKNRGQNKGQNKGQNRGRTFRIGGVSGGFLGD